MHWHGKRAEMKFRAANSDGYLPSVWGQDNEGNNAHVKPLSLSFVWLLVVLLSIQSLSYGNSGSQSQMHFPPLNRTLATSARIPGGVQSRTSTRRPSLQRHTRRSINNSGRVTTPSTRSVARSYSDPAIGKTGFLAATQVAAGGGLDPQGQFPILEGDFNGDGKKDLATVVQYLAGTPWVLSLSVVMGNGDGTFQPAVLTPIPGNACLQFVVGDVNGDAKDDIILVQQADLLHPFALAEVFISNGNGTFTSGNTYTITSTPLAGGTLADVNKDGKLDLVLEDQASPANVWTLLGNGDGTFQAATSVSLGGESGTYVTFADLNGDGILDVAQIGSGGELEVYLATSATSYAAPAYYFTSDYHLNAGGITAGDLNGDGKPELVVPNGTDDNLTVYVNNGDGTFQTGVYYDVALSAVPSGNVADVAPYGIAIADVNGDGKADVITSNYFSSDITVLLGNGDGTLQSASVGYAVGGFPCSPAVIADFNGDGLPDAVVGDCELSLVYLKGHGDGTFKAALNYYSPIPDRGLAFGLAIASGDFNGDGQTDFVIGNIGDPTVGLTVFLSQPNGTLAPGVNYGAGDYESVAVADFDGDGHLDIAVADTVAGLVDIFKGAGDGTFALRAQFTTDASNTGPNAVVVGDFNHDGYPDLAVVNYTGMNVAILLNNGNGTFGISAVYPLSGRTKYPAKIVAASLKGNGNLDLLVPLLSPAVAVLSGNGDGTFMAETDVTVDDVPQSVGAGDLNQDGKLDLAVTLPSGIDVVLGNGDGTFQAPQFFPTTLQDTQWDQPYTAEVQIADVDGDGKLDLVYTNANYSTVGILFGKGDGTFYDPMEFPSGGYSWGLSIADMNRDGAPDVVTVGDGYSGVTALLNANGSAVVPNYVVSSSASSLNLSAGASATLDITLTPQNGYSGMVSFSCAGLPAQVSCVFNPQNVLITGSQQFAVGLAISNGVARAAASPSGKSPQSEPLKQFVTLGPFGAFAFVLLGSGKKRKRIAALSMILPVLCMSFLLTSCGGAARSTIQNTGTSSRTYVVQVNATGVDGNSGRSVSRTLYLNLRVQ